MNLFKNHTRAFWTPSRFRSLYFGILLLVLSLGVQIILGQYAASASIGANPAHDLFLDHLPAVNLDFFIVSGALLMWVFGSWLLATRPNKLLFGLKAIALVVVLRAFFLSLTHVGAYPHALDPGPLNFGWKFYSSLTFQGDFFFSGHTGFPFLFALIFWNDRRLRWLFLVLSVCFGMAVLLAHVHYSIDVFAAPFIVYGGYVIAARLFPEDYKLTG